MNTVHPSTLVTDEAALNQRRKPGSVQRFVMPRNRVNKFILSVRLKEMHGSKRRNAHSAESRSGKIGTMKTEIESAKEHFGTRWYVRTPLTNKAGQTFMLRCHATGFKTRKAAEAYAKTKRQAA